MSRRLLVLNERDPRHPQAGGAEVHLREIFRRLAAGGDEVTLVAAGFPGAPAEEDVDGLRVLRRGDARVGYYARVPSLYRRLRAQAPFDVVVEDLNKFPFFARLWVREPLVVLAHHFFGRTAFRQAAAPVAAALVAAEWLVPRLYRGLPVVAVSESTRAELVRGGLNRADVCVVPNGIDHRRYRPGAGPPGKPEARSVTASPAAASRRKISRRCTSAPPACGWRGSRSFSTRRRRLIAARTGVRAAATSRSRAPRGRCVSTSSTRRVRGP